MEFIQNLTMMQRLMGVAGVVLIVVLLLIVNKRQKSSGGGKSTKSSASPKKSRKRGRGKKGSDGSEDGDKSPTAAPAVPRMVPRLPSPGSADPLADEFGQAQSDDDDWAPVEGSWETADSDMASAASGTSALEPLSEPEQAPEQASGWAEMAEDFDPATGWADPTAASDDSKDADAVSDWSASAGWDTDEAAADGVSGGSDAASMDMNEWDDTTSSEDDPSEWSNSTLDDAEGASEWMPVDESASPAEASEWAPLDQAEMGTDEEPTFESPESELLSDGVPEDEPSFGEWSAASDGHTAGLASEDSDGEVDDMHESTDDSKTPSFTDWGTDSLDDTESSSVAAAANSWVSDAPEAEPRDSAPASDTASESSPWMAPEPDREEAAPSGGDS